jgi:hypothetical protein
MTSWKNKSRPKENKSELKRRLNKQTHAYTVHIQRRWERILNTIERVNENMHRIVKGKWKSESWEKEQSAFACAIHIHYAYLYMMIEKEETFR